MTQPNAKILIVDDLEHMRAALKGALARLGFSKVMACGDGTEALAALRSEDFSLVISDWRMEPMDGLQLLAEIRADTGLSALPFILVTAETEPNLHERATAAGASLVLNKPFGAEALRSALAGLNV
jgi:two-component system chemotaxis response regulator CheY